MIELKNKYDYGAEKIVIVLGIAPATANKIMRKAKLTRVKKRTKIIKHYERGHSNALWHIDYTMLHDKLWLLLAVDDHSRFIVAFKLMKAPNVKDTIMTLNQAFQKYGVPREIITDHGTQFYSVRGGVSTFDIFCLQNEIKHILARVRHPETNGKVERKMRDVKEFLARINYSSSTLSPAELKKELADWVEFHNYSRIHFAYHYYQFGDVKLRKKFYFIRSPLCCSQVLIMLNTSHSYPSVSVCDICLCITQHP